MTQFLKTSSRGSAAAAAAREDVQQKVAAIVEDVRSRGDAAVREHSARLDQWEPEQFRLPPEQIEQALARVPQQVLDDIRFAQQQVRTFAEHQLDSLREFEVETLPGVHLGQKHIPVGAAGAYVPGGRYPLLASAHMTIATAKTAGVSRVVACTPPIRGEIPDATVAAMHLAGADEIHLLGGVQAVAAMALGTETVSEVDMLAGPATPSSPRPSASCSARSASTCSPGPPRSSSWPTRPPIPSSPRSTCSARPSTDPTPRRC